MTLQRQDKRSASPGGQDLVGMHRLQTAFSLPETQVEVEITSVSSNSHRCAPQMYTFRANYISIKMAEHAVNCCNTETGTL